VNVPSSQTTAPLLAKDSRKFQLRRTTEIAWKKAGKAAEQEANKARRTNSLLEFQMEPLLQSSDRA
jgi:hypothetical protein